MENSTDRIPADDAFANMVRAGKNPTEILGGTTPFTIEGLLVGPQPLGMPAFRWAYTDVDTRGVHVRIIVEDTDATAALRTIGEHFPSFQPSVIRPDTPTQSTDDTLVWQGTFKPVQRKSWLRRLFSRQGS